MSTTIRTEVSKRSAYYVEKYRYLELKNFCFQYPIWKKAYDALDGLSKSPDLSRITSNSNESPTEKCAMARAFYKTRIEMVENTCNDAAGEIAPYLLKGVTEDISYDKLYNKFFMPCSRPAYYSAYRRFFWMLNKARD